MKISGLISSVLYFPHVVHFASNWFCSFFVVCFCVSAYSSMKFNILSFIDWLSLQDWVHDFSFFEIRLDFPFVVNCWLLRISCNYLTTAEICFVVEKCFGKWEKKIFGDQFPSGKLQEINWTFSVKFICCILTSTPHQYWTRLLRSLLLSLVSGFNPEPAYFCLKIIWHNKALLLFCKETRGYSLNI